MKIALAQINTIVGDVSGNLKLAKDFIEQAEKQGSDLILFPELLTTGYPPKDLLFREDLIDLNLEAKDELVKLTENISATIIFGYVERTNKNGCKPLYNAACVASGGKVIQTRFKTLLPTYDVFEEYRYFEPGPKVFEPFEIKGRKVGVIICEETWNNDYWVNNLYDIDPVAEMVKAGATDIACINSSPYRIGIPETRRKMIAKLCIKHDVTFSYVNQIGYNDEVGFDGNSFVLNKAGKVIAFGLPFYQEIVYADTVNGQAVSESSYQFDWQLVAINALTTGIKDYCGKIGIKGPAIIGLSGGIDSALVAYLATVALGKDQVIGVGMPSEFSSEGSVTDAEMIAKKLGIRFLLEPIKSQHNEFRNAVDSMLMQNGESTMVPSCSESGVTDENLQARIRGMLLMALANYYNGIVLSTGNKSEMAVGYCTLYGDMCGGLASISDLYKTQIFDICKYINTTLKDEIIPWNTINKPPSAELRKDQKDSDSLPPYETLDAILFKYVDEAKSPKQIAKEMLTLDAEIKYEKATGRNLKNDIVWTCNAVIRNEFKRKQSPTGLKVSQKLFKYGWTQPIVHKLKTVI